MSQKEEIQARREKELAAYIADNSSAKPLFTSMKEISDWLKTREK